MGCSNRKFEPAKCRDIQLDKNILICMTATEILKDSGNLNPTEEEAKEALHLAFDFFEAYNKAKKLHSNLIKKGLL